MQQPHSSAGLLHLLVPPQLTFEAGCRLVRDVFALPSAGACTIDFAQLRWVEPFAMVHVASAITQKATRCPALTFRALGHVGGGYADSMGFFRELGLGEPSGAKPGNHENYLPIQALDLRELRGDAGRRGIAAGRIVEEHTRGIARTLARQAHGPLWETLQYALREIIRNAAEHSESDHVLYCGQYWPTKHRVEVAILDEGIGIARSLRRNPLLSDKADADALRLSLRPGVSGVAYEGASIDERDEWSNSGFGLYVVSELCRRGGSLTIVSGDFALRASANGVDELAASHAGTALRLILDTSQLRSIAASLELIVYQGEKLARQNGEAATASGASKRVFR